MSILSRVELLEEAMGRQGGDAGYKIVLVKDGETCEERTIRSRKGAWPPDRIIWIKFVSAAHKASYC